MPRGGSRPGAGRPKKQVVAPEAPVKSPAKKRVPPKVDADGYKTDPNWPFGKQEAGPQPDLSDLMPLDYLLEVMRDPTEERGRRMQAATLAAPYCHPKKGESSKKDDAAAKTKAAAAGKFGRREPPKLVAAGGKPV